MANIFILPVDVFLYILSYLDIFDRIAFVLTCQIFRQICVDVKVFRKMDLSRHAISTKQRSVADTFFRDRQLTQHIRELNISNFPVLNWQMDNQLEEFISSCPQLEALHVLDCGMSLQRLCRILMQPPKLTSLSWSLWDFTSEDTEFVKSMKSTEGICLKNIKYLRLQMNESSHIQIAKYLMLSCQDLEELEIYKWHTDYSSKSCMYNNPLAADYFIQPFASIALQHLHSLTVVVARDLLLENNVAYRKMLSEFIFSLVRSKSSSTKWKKLWIFPSIAIRRRHPINLSLLHEVHPHDFQSVEAIAADAAFSANAVDTLKTFFERIGDNTVRSLHLRLPSSGTSIIDFCDPISRVGGRSLKLLRLPVVDKIRAEQNIIIHSFFSSCSEITELDLLDIHFEKDICEPLSELKHLTKVQLMQCAISSKYNTDQVEISKANLLTFVENCKNITHFEVHGCGNCLSGFSCGLRDSDLLALAKLRNLESLTLDKIAGIREWTFLKSISEHCKLWTTLRIKYLRHFNHSHIQALMESVKFLKHLAIYVAVPILKSGVFWNHLSHAKNLERLCIVSRDKGTLNIPVAVEALKSLPQLRVLHLHSRYQDDAGDVHDQVKQMLEEKQSDCRLSFEIVTGGRKNTWINHETGYNLISDKALPLNKAELCDMTRILDIPRS